MSAYYNEIDPYAAQWLRNLISAGHIAPGEVDERSILDVSPDDIKGFIQCHFFAGIGVWSYAMRLAGWPDELAGWTGSCPCQPFSVAGAGRGTADERHLWPHWFWLIEQRRPEVIFGEQVEAAIRHGWLDLVQTDMEGIGYAFAPVGIPAAGVGAPHIRQRLWFVASALGNSNNNKGLERHRGGYKAESERNSSGVLEAARGSETNRLADNIVQQRQDRKPAVRTVHDANGRNEGAAATAGLCGNMRPGPTNGHWRNADWLGCRDEQWRPVEPGAFPLVNGASARVGRLRAYGNAIVPQVAAEVIAAFMEHRP